MIWGWKKVFHANGNKKKAEVVILILDTIDFKTKTTARDEEGHYIIVKGSIQQGDITIIDAFKMGAPKYTKLILTNIKGETNSNTITVGDFNTHLHQ